MSPAKAWWQQYGLTALLGLAACGGLAALGIETDWGKNLRAAGAPERSLAGATELTPTLPAFKMGELDAAFKESAERPLFTPSRRPPPSVQAAAAPQMKRGQFKLAGTVVNAGISVAYLVEIAANKTHRINKGAEVLGQPGLVVDAIEPSRVVLKMGEETEILELRTAASPPRSAVPVAPQGNPPGQPVATPPTLATVSPATANPVAATLAPRAPAQAANAGDLQPRMGESQLPGFVPFPPLPRPASGAAETSNQNDGAALRRRRFQTGQPGTPQ
jgi:hypothetical protein